MICPILISHPILNNIKKFITSWMRPLPIYKYIRTHTRELKSL